MSEESPRPLELDWSEEEIIDALSDEVVVLADIESESAGHDTKSSIEAALDQVGTRTLPSLSGSAIQLTGNG